MAGYGARHRILEAWHIHRLEAADPAARLRAIEALGRVRSARAVPRLCRLLDSTSREERTAAAVALGAIGPEAEEAVMPLVRLFFSDPPDPGMLRMAPEDTLTDLERATRGALARIGPAAIPAILEAGLGAPRPPEELLLLVGFEEGLLPLVDVGRSGVARIRLRSCFGPRGAWHRPVGEAPAAAPASALESLVRHAAGALWEDPEEVSRLAPVLNRWRAGDDANLDRLPLALVSSDDGLARRLAAGADARVARELRWTCLGALSTTTDVTSAVPFLLDCFDDQEMRPLAADALARAGPGAVGPLLHRLENGAGSARFHATFALLEAGIADIEVARAIVEALPGAEGEAWMRLTGGLLGRIGKNAVTALDEASESADPALRRAARVALCIQGRD
jgi:hypothetical protein